MAVRLDTLNRQYNLPDHTDLNRARFPWVDFLRAPEFYASRVWEYPWAITEATLSAMMLCADIGCGMTPFPMYLEKYWNCRVTGFDHDYGDNHYYCHGVSPSFIRRTGLNYVPRGINQISWWPSDYFDRMFCISVLEHMEKDEQYSGIREMARILAPGGLALISVDIVKERGFCDIPRLIEESGLSLVGDADFEPPQDRFGIFTNGLWEYQVYGMVLRKDA